MARDKHHGQKAASTARRKPAPDPYTSKIIKKQSEHRQENALRHAVTHHDVDTLDDWDEPEY